MKKFIFVIPLMAISLLVSCNSGGGGNIDKPLTKEEFDYANSLIDVEKVQINSLTYFEDTFESEEGKTSSSVIYDVKKKLAPSINYITSLLIDRIGETEFKISDEEYSRLIPDDDEHCEYVTKGVEEKDWNYTIEDVKECYRYPTQCSLELALKDVGVDELEPALTYENTEFKNGKFVYEGLSPIVSYNYNRKTSDEPPRPVTINITYENKKLTNVDVESEEVIIEEDVKTTSKFTASFTYAYEDITPTWPLIDYKVNETEFNNGINLNNVSMLQVHNVFEDTFAEYSYSEKEVCDYEFSPLIAYEFMKHFDGDLLPAYQSKKYFKVENIGEEKGKMASKEADQSGEWPDYWAEEDDVDFIDLKDQAPTNILKQILDSCKFSLKKEFKYDNFEFKENKYVFESEAVMSGFELEPLTAEITFENKILKKFKLDFQWVDAPEFEKILYNTTTEFSYAYEDITPTWPL